MRHVDKLRVLAAGLFGLTSALLTNNILAGLIVLGSGWLLVFFEVQED